MSAESWHKIYLSLKTHPWLLKTVWRASDCLFFFYMHVAYLKRILRRGLNYLIETTINIQILLSSSERSFFLHFESRIVA